ncbi:MAG: CBS domain-containing protein [Saprospiraceae bacterium]|nr:CBS domain-containing protein [Saprospiraceae bacterium]
MTKDFTVLSPDDSIETAYYLFEENNYEIIPIVENGVVIGILDRASLGEFFAIQSAKV